jgi:glyceraldehyde 3-phosphate dehydrogenase
LLGKALDVVAVNDIVPANNLAYLLKYDSTRGGSVGRSSARKKASRSYLEGILAYTDDEVVPPSTPARGSS